MDWPIECPMDANLKKAFQKSGIKLVGGLLIVGGLIGVRIVTADPDGIQSQIEELETVEAELASDAAERGVSADPVDDDSLMARMRNVMPSAAPSGPDLDRLVSCRLSGGVQFMRAGDCLSRGGQSKDFDTKQ